MNINLLSLFTKLFLTFTVLSCSNYKTEVEKVFPIPTERQLSWQKLDYYPIRALMSFPFSKYIPSFFSKSARFLISNRLL